jgi:LAO/AO transport system kinase
VGVGQDEVDVARAAHTTVVVSAPGLGDDIQAIKAGILEIADIHVVSKCDKPESDRTISDLKGMLMLGLAVNRGSGWKAPVLPVTSIRDEGVAALLEAIDGHRVALEASGEITGRRHDIARRRLLRAGEDILRERFARRGNGGVEALVGEVAARKRSPHAAALALLDMPRNGEDA